MIVPPYTNNAIGFINIQDVIVIIISVDTVI
jgi:hypothetical protein